MKKYVLIEKESYGHSTYATQKTIKGVASDEDTAIKWEASNVNRIYKEVSLLEAVEKQEATIEFEKKQI